MRHFIFSHLTNQRYLILTRSLRRQNPKNAQEAHEAIRPSILESGTFAEPSSLSSKLSKIDLALYSLIYYRTLASQMVDKIVKSTTCLIDVGDGEFTFKVTGSQIVNKGWSQVDGSSSNSSASILPPILSEGQTVDLKSFQVRGCEQHSCCRVHDHI